MQRKYRKEVQGTCPRCGLAELSERKSLPSDPEGSKTLHCDKCGLDFVEIYDASGNYEVSEGTGC
jgi:transcription elongation factor Elf1